MLGGGIVEGGVVLIGGDPGIGKSTLLLQAMDALQRAGLPALYVTGEESGAQVALRSRRLGIDGSQVQLLAEIQLEKILATVDATQPAVVVIDSIQTTYSDQLTSARGLGRPGARMRGAPHAHGQGHGHCRDSGAAM